MSLFIGVGDAKSEYMFVVTMDMTSIGKTAHMYVGMLLKGDVQPRKNR